MSNKRRYIFWTQPFESEIQSLIDRGAELLTPKGSPGYSPYTAVLKTTEAAILDVFDGEGDNFIATENKVFIREGTVIIEKDPGRGLTEDVVAPPYSFVFGLDVPIAFSDYAGRRNVAPGSSAFDRTTAEMLIKADAIRNFARDGHNEVNVVVVDGGMDPGYVGKLGNGVPAKNLEGMIIGGNLPDSKPSRRHANGVARNVRAVAPDVNLIDVAILPARIDHIDAFTMDVAWKLLKLFFKVLSQQDKSWVIVCAWGLLDRAYDRQLGTFAEHRGHPLSVMFRLLSWAGADIVFSAGNNGMFWPDTRSGPTDRGPFRSIFGSNGLPEVLTVGAVDATGTWIGESSQGPEPAGLRPDGVAARKPDVCAPSWFHEFGDSHSVLAGTSGACATAAGVVAAVRRVKNSKDLSQAALIDAIRATARREGYADGADRSSPSEWRYGSGIIDCAQLASFLSELGELRGGGTS